MPSAYWNENHCSAPCPPTRGPVFARLQQAWYNDQIDNSTYFQLIDSGEETIAAALERLQIGELESRGTMMERSNRSAERHRNR